MTIKEARQAAKLTQQKVADAIGVSLRHYQRIDAGEVDVGELSGRSFLALADTLGVDPHDLL